jgi:hypothetical protein
MAKKKPAPLTIEFDAYLPPVTSAILIGGTGDEMQIKLSVALKQSPAALRMSSMTGRRLHVVVTEIPDLSPVEIVKQNDRTNTRRNPLYAKKAAQA